MTPEAIAQKQQIHDEAQARADEHLARIGVSHEKPSHSIVGAIMTFVAAVIASYILVTSFAYW